MCFALVVIGIITFSQWPAGSAAETFAVSVVVALICVYYLGFHMICRVEVADGQLRWRHALIGGGTAPLSQVRSVRCTEKQRGSGTTRMAVVGFAGRRPLKFGASLPGLDDFLTALQAGAPHITLESPDDGTGQ